jgi:hypothetical protein
LQSRSGLQEVVEVGAQIEDGGAEAQIEDGTAQKGDFRDIEVRSFRRDYLYLWG